MSGGQSIDEVRQRAHALLQSNSLQEAKRLFEQLRAVSPGDWEAWHMLGALHGMLGELQYAEACSRRAVELRPEFAGSHTNLGNALSALGRTQEAIPCYQQALEINPQDAQVHLNLGNLYKSKSRFAEAEVAYRTALQIQPNWPEAVGNLAILQQEQGRLDEAVQNYQTAVQLSPQNPNLLYGLGCGLQELGQLAAARDIFQRVLSLQPDHAEAYAHLGAIMQQLGKREEAIDFLKQSLRLNPAADENRRRLEGLYAALVPAWHFPMMNDEERNDAYDRALRKVVKPDSVVLDIGSGSGLLAMMAARAGARKVISCEVVQPVANMAREIVARNGYADTITLLNKRSTKINPATEMPDKADVLVSEILDVGVLGEHVIPVIQHARANLVKPDAKVIPAGATVYAALVESESLYRNFRVDTAAGFDVSAFNDFARASSYFQAQLSLFSYRYIGKPFQTFDFDLTNPDATRTGCDVFRVTPEQDATCHAIVFWFRLDLDDEISLVTEPENTSTCWMQAIQIVHPPRFMRAGESVAVEGRFDSTAIQFALT